MDNQLALLENSVGPVSRETYVKLREFETRFKQWNSRINLVASSTLATFWERHIVDSAQLYPHVRGAGRLVDLGSGGGFPALVLAILCYQSQSHFYLVESNRKKASFLTLMVSELNLNASVIPLRIEQCYDQIPSVDIITSRALAGLDLLLELSKPWFDNGARAYFQKGREYQAEIENSRKRWGFDLIEHQSSISADSVILHVSNVKSRLAAGE